MQAHEAQPTVCTNIPNKISISCKVHLGVCYWKNLQKNKQKKLPKMQVFMLFLEDILVFTFDHKYTHTHWVAYSTLYACLCWRKLHEDLSVLWSVLEELSQERKVFFSALYLAVEPLGEENVIFVLHQIYVTIGKYSSYACFRNTHCRLPIMQFEVRHKGDKCHLNLWVTAPTFGIMSHD